MFWGKNVRKLTCAHGHMCSALWTILSPSVAVLCKHCNDDDDDFNYICNLCWKDHTNVTLWDIIKLPHKSNLGSYFLLGM